MAGAAGRTHSYGVDSVDTALLFFPREERGAARQRPLSLPQPLSSHSAVPTGEHSDVPTLGAVTNQRSRPPSSLYLGRASPRGAPNVPFDESKGSRGDSRHASRRHSSAGAGCNYFGAPARGRSLPRRSSSAQGATALPLSHGSLFASPASFRRLRALKQQEVDRGLDRTVVNAEVVGGRLCGVGSDTSPMDDEDGDYAVLEVRVPARYWKLRRAR